MNINGKRYKITKHDLLNRENLEKEEAKRCQKGRQNSEGLTGFKLLLIAYLKDQNILNQEGNLHNIYQINVGRYSHFNMNTFFGENYITNQANIDDLSTLYNEVITIDINTNNTAQTTKVGPFSVILAPMGFHVQGVDDITKSKNIVIENNGNYYLPKDGIQGNIKTCLFDSHAYAYKNIYTNDNGEKIIVLENPRDTKEKLHIPLKDIKEFCMFRKNQIDITRLLEDILKSHISSISNKAKEELNQNLSSNSL